MRTSFRAPDGTTINELVEEVVEQLQLVIDDTIYQHDIYNDDYKEVKNEVLRLISENIEEYYDEQ